MAPKRKVDEALAEKPHGYEFLGPYVCFPLPMPASDASI